MKTKIYRNFADINGKFCKSGKSETIWEIWAVDEHGVALMSYNTYKPLSKKIPIKRFIHRWSIVNGLNGNIIGKLKI